MRFLNKSPLLLTLLLVACVSTNPATGKKNFTLMGENAEFSMGKQVAEDAIKETGQYTGHPALTAYYQDIANRMVGVTERANKPFEFLLLDAPTFNAWAVPGYINMYRGILPFFNNEAEFVSVIAHEVGHVTARHSAQQMTHGTLAQVLVTGVAIYAGSQIEDAAAANALYAAGAFGAGVAMKSYSRAHEREADRLAMRYMERMGYDARQSHNMFHTMERFYNLTEAKYAYFNDGAKLPKSPFYHLLLSHPEPHDRMAQVADLKGLPDDKKVRIATNTASATPKDDPHGKKRYLSMIDGLPYGPKIEQGIAGDDILYRPEERFVFTLPEGYMWQAAPEKKGKIITTTWKAYNNTNKSWAFQRTESLISRGSGKDLIEEIFPNATTDITRVPLNRATAYMAKVNLTSTYKNWPAGTYRVLALPLPEKSDGTNAHDFALLALGVKASNKNQFATLDPKFKAALSTAKVLTPSEADKLQSLRVQIHTVRSGETVKSLSQKMAKGALKEKWFRTLNGMSGRASLRAGQQVKLIVDPN